MGPVRSPRHDRDAEEASRARSWWEWFFVGSAAVWIVAVHATLWLMDRSSAPRVLWGDENTYLESAGRLLNGDPGWWPEPLWPPLYPQFLAGILRIGGGDLVWLRLAQTALLGVTALLLFDLTERWTKSRSAAWTAAALTLGYPPLVAFSHFLWPEVVHLFLFVAAVWWLAVRAGSLAGWTAAGLALGLALLTKSLLLPFVPVLVVAALRDRGLGGAPRKLAAVVILAALTVAPTLAVNQARTGRPGLANSATFNLWVGLNDAGRDSFRHDVVWPAYQQWVASAGSDAERNRMLRARIRDFVVRHGPVEVLANQLSKQYFRLFDAGSYLTDQLPGGAATTSAGAGYLSLGPAVSRAVAAATVVSILALYAAATAGFVVGGCAGHRWVRVLLAFVVYNLLLFLWLHVKTRYRIQMLPAAFVGVACLVAWLEAGWRPRVTAARAVAATVVIGLLVFLALA